tara:strand:+ start:1450 stop:2205 length:756 start_codon:yes stop_codon:yes gene_type:complete
MKICNEIMALSLAVRTNVLADVNHAVEGLKCDLDGIYAYSTSIVDWLKPVVDLSNFHVYPMNGITQGLDWWYDKERRSVTMERGDYQWIYPKAGIKRIHYVSVPSAIDGNYIDIPKDTPTAVDLAYVGSTAVKKIELPKNVEYVFYSFSKPFGVRNVRTGWIFTRNPDTRLDAITNSAKYYNYYANSVAETIINKFDIDYVWNALKDKQIDVCNTYGFTPSDSVWLATTNNPAYDKFKRGDVNRLCLAPCY